MEKPIIKETLLGLSMIMISAGSTMLMAKDIFGLILIVVGLGIIAIRGYLKVK